MKTIKITDINPASYNPRVISKKEFEELNKSISEFGLVDPIIINLKNSIIIGGHQRYDVLLNQYMDNGEYNELNLIELGDIGWVFPTKEVKFKKQDYLKLNLALNKISGEWEVGKLNLILDELSEDGFDVELTGFNEKDVGELFDNGNNTVEMDEVDELFGELIGGDEDSNDDGIDFDEILFDEKSINYELIFKNDEDKLIWENFIQKIQSEKGESLSQKIIGVLNKYV